MIRTWGDRSLPTRMRWTVWSAGLIPAAAGAVLLSGIMGDPAEAANGQRSRTRDPASCGHPSRARPGGEGWAPLSRRACRLQAA